MCPPPSRFITCISSGPHAWLSVYGPRVWILFERFPLYCLRCNPYSLLPPFRSQAQNVRPFWEIHNYWFECRKCLLDFVRELSTVCLRIYSLSASRRPGQEIKFCFPSFEIRHLCFECISHLVMCVPESVLQMFTFPASSLLHVRSCRRPAYEPKMCVPSLQILFVCFECLPFFLSRVSFTGQWYGSCARYVHFLALSLIRVLSSRRLGADTD